MWSKHSEVFDWFVEFLILETTSSAAISNGYFYPEFHPSDFRGIVSMATCDRVVIVSHCIISKCWENLYNYSYASLRGVISSSITLSFLLLPFSVLNCPHYTRAVSPVLIFSLTYIHVKNASRLAFVELVSRVWVFTVWAIRLIWRQFPHCKNVKCYLIFYTEQVSLCHKL